MLAVSGRLRRASRPCGIVVVLAAFASACTGRYQSDFSVVVVNRTTNTIQVLANGNAIGDVASGQSGTFSLHLNESNTNVFSNGVAPTPEAAVVLSAKDLKTNAISTTKSLTLSQSTPTYVTFSPSDFPSVTPTVARFTTS